MDGTQARPEGPLGLMADSKTYHIHKGDCIEHMQAMPESSVDFTVFSPPFPSLYAYTSSDCDIGNSEDLRSEAKLHLSWFYKGLARVLKPGRVAVVHVAQIPRMARSGGRGLHDFRGANIRIGERAGLIYEYDWTVTKNPQSQALRTHSHSLQFAGLERDRAKSRGCLSDYLIKFLAPGENAEKIKSPNEVSRNDWIAWAEGAWTWHEIRETDTLNVREGRDEDDTKHICPLQLSVISRLVRLYSNPGEIVFSPFAGIGSEGYESIKLGRRFYGCEIKESYYDAAAKNLQRAEISKAEKEMMLFDM